MNSPNGKSTIPGRSPIQIRENSNGVITLDGSIEIGVSTQKEMGACLAQGSSSRAIGSTNMNFHSMSFTCHPYNHHRADAEIQCGSNKRNMLYR